MLAPERHPALGLVGLGLVHPALADVRHVADDARRGEPGQVAHDRLLEVLGLLEREPPVLGERDHVAHVEVVRRDRRLVLQREAEVEQRLGGVVDPAHQHALVAHVAHAGVEHRPGGLRHQRRDRLGAVDVGVDGQRHPARAGLGADPRRRPRRRRPAASAGAGPSAPWWRAGCRGCCRPRAACRGTPRGSSTACWPRRRRRRRRRAPRASGAGSRASRRSGRPACRPA